MGFTLIRTDGDGEWGDRLAAAAPQLACRPGEEWTLAIEARSSARLLVATGPRRAECGSDWLVSPATHAAGWSHRRELASLPDGTIEVVEEMVRDLVWRPVRVAGNPVRRSDPALGWAFEAAVLGELQAEREALVVRFGTWSGEEDGPRYVCKVECLPCGAMDAPAWRWWSPLVRHPDELARHLRAALLARGRSEAPATATREYWGWGAAAQAGA